MAGRSLVLGAAALLIAAQALGPGPGDAPGYVSSALCMSCHNGLTTRTGEDISFGFNWRTGMMANAARDPYWQASVRREVMDHPVAAAVIENECSRCHMPLANEVARASGGSGEVFVHLPVGQSASPEAALAADGVTCVACHAIVDEGLGSEESFSGRFRLSAPGTVFGPYAVDEGRTRTMQSATGFRPTTSDHLAQAEFCATCHTLITHSLGPDGEIIGELPEQVPFLEWKHSSYEGAASCPSCHMPVVSGETPISSVLGQPRSEVNRHVFVGGNSFMQRMLGTHRDELGVTPPAGAMSSATERTQAHLQENAGRISIDDVQVSDGKLVAAVVVENLAGHKLPTAYPSRRVWIEVRVTDVLGKTIFSSGRPLEDGSIEGNDNDLDESRYEPHHASVASPDEVQIYEAILEGPAGEVTTGLLSATAYRKDNRLLPDGFDPETAEDRVAVRGMAAVDGDFTGGGDRIEYVVDLEGATPSRVRAVLWFQSVGYRWAHNLAGYDAMEARRFVRMYEETAATAAVQLAEATFRF